MTPEDEKSAIDPKTADADLAQYLSQARRSTGNQPKPPPQAQPTEADRRYRFLLADPNFAVANVGPKPPPPPPKSIADWWGRLERSLLLVNGLGYLLVGVALAGRQAPLVLSVLAGLGSLVGLAGDRWVFLGPGLAAIAVSLSIGSPVREFIALMALMVGTALALWTLTFGNTLRKDGRKRQAFINGATVASGVAAFIMLLFSLVVNPIVGAVTLLGLGALVLGLPLWPIMADRGLTQAQQAMTIASLAGLGLAIGHWF